MESELVAGFFTEHSAVGFVFFFLGEYTSIITISSLAILLFFGANVIWALFFIFLILWIRAVLPRLRFDQQLNLGWVYLLPFIMGYLILIPSYIWLFQYSK